jgi:uncharacterized protein YlxW (UPF0749 family)
VARHDAKAVPDETAEPTTLSGWPAVASLLSPRLGRRQFIIGALTALLGFAVVVQVHQTSETNLSGLSQDELVRILDEAQVRADALTDEAADLDREREALESGSDTRAAALAAAERNAQVQGILTGRLPAVGPGVEIVVSDSQETLRPSVMLNMLEELRNAGAEAIEINGVRVVASSSFTGSAGRVVLDHQLLEAPYDWLVIGDPQTIATALEIPGGADAAVRRDGAEVEVTQLAEVSITALTSPSELSYATPVPEPS